MKKIFLLSLITLTTIKFSFAQNVAINADASLPNSSAMLDVKSANKGLLIPRVALTGPNDVTTIATPATSLLVYNTLAAGTGTTAVTPGYYYWAGAAWVQLAVSKEYAYLYNTGSDIIFSFNPVRFYFIGKMTSGIFRQPNNSSILFTVAGVFKIEFSVSAGEINQIAISKNGIQVPGSRYSSAASSQQNSGMVIVDILPGDEIELFPVFGNLTLSGGGHVNASIMITQL